MNVQTSKRSREAVNTAFIAAATRAETELQNSIDCTLEFIRGAGFAQDRPFHKSVGHTCRAVTAQENERQPPGRNYLGDRPDVDALQIDVEDREIVLFNLGKRPPLNDTPRFGNHPVPKLLDHLGKHHPNECLIFDEEYRCLSHQLPSSIRTNLRTHIEQL